MHSTRNVSQRCCLITLPIEYDHNPTSIKEMALIGVVRRRLRFSHFFLNKLANAYVLNVLELEATTSSLFSDLVHHVNYFGKEQQKNVSEYS